MKNFFDPISEKRWVRIAVFVFDILFVLGIVYFVWETFLH